jgi:hypothetical protein
MAGSAPHRTLPLTFSLSNIAISDISMNAIVYVENALREIPIGISGARTGIRAFLNVIKDINVVSGTIRLNI